MNKKGFTLVELLAVIAILAILVIIALPNVLKMFNDAKKNSFLTETKTIYSEVSKKYISESMKGNKLSYVSSEDDTKLEMTGRDLQYCVFLNTDGTIKSMKVSNGEWVAELPSGKKITDLKSTDLKEGNLDNEECAIKEPEKFENDSWQTIASVAKSCVDNPDSCPYNVGDEKEVKLEKYGTHKVRIANLSSPTEEGCGTEGFSQSACGFVVEFVGIITEHYMNKTYTSGGGWSGSNLNQFLNDKSWDGKDDKELSIIKALPSNLRNAIIDTYTISWPGGGSERITSNDKLYLLTQEEIYGSGTQSNPFSRQLDYYNIKGVTTSNCTDAQKKNGENTVDWWLRSASPLYSGTWYNIRSDGGLDGYSGSQQEKGVSPAFRIG